MTMVNLSIDLLERCVREYYHHTTTAATAARASDDDDDDAPPPPSSWMCDPRYFNPLLRHWEAAVRQHACVVYTPHQLEARLHALVTLFEQQQQHTIEYNRRRIIILVSHQCQYPVHPGGGHRGPRTSRQSALCRGRTAAVFRESS